MFLLIVAGFETYLCTSWLGPFWSTERGLFWILFFFLQVLFAAQLWLYYYFFRGDENTIIPFESQMRNFSFHSMGIISFLFSLTFFRDLIALVAWPLGHSDIHGMTSSRIVFGLSFLGYGIGFFNARFRAETPHIQVPVADLPPALRGLKIVQLSDMHLGTGPGPLGIKKLVDQALSLSPDIIALTGDIFDGRIVDMEPELKHLSRLKAKHGVYFCLGNHECYWSWKECVAKVKEFGFIPLLNEGVTVMIHDTPLFIAGINDPAAASVGGVGPVVPVPPEDSQFNLMLVHQPQLSKLVKVLPYHLQLSGHTHAGQFFPWNFVVKKMYEISSGLGKSDNLWVYVSAGSGYWGPPVRLGTLGEVTELNLA